MRTGAPTACTEHLQRHREDRHGAGHVTRIGRSSAGSLQIDLDELPQREVRRQLRVRRRQRSTRRHKRSAANDAPRRCARSSTRLAAATAMRLGQIAAHRRRASASTGVHRLAPSPAAAIALKHGCRSARRRASTRSRASPLLSTKMPAMIRRAPRQKDNTRVVRSRSRCRPVLCATRAALRTGCRPAVPVQWCPRTAAPAECQSSASMLRARAAASRQCARNTASAPLGVMRLLMPLSNARSSSTPRQKSTPWMPSARSERGCRRRRADRRAGSSRGCCCARSCARPVRAIASSGRARRGRRCRRRATDRREKVHRRHALRKRLRTCRRRVQREASLIDGVEQRDEHRQP